MTPFLLFPPSKSISCENPKAKVLILAFKNVKDLSEVWALSLLVCKHLGRQSFTLGA